jgi:hypothetical protein
MKFIEFMVDGHPISVNADFVSAVVPRILHGIETGCSIFTVGDPNPFVTDELYADVMAKLNGSTKGGNYEP